MHMLNQCCSLLLWIYLLTTAECDAGCTLQAFRTSSYFDENFELSGLKQSYNSGETVKVPCRVGHGGFFKLICTTNRWTGQGGICTPKSCGHPGDVPFADFQLVEGSDYVFGSQVLYTCHVGYQMTSYTATRNCLQGGWDGHLPVCEPVPCSPLTLDDKVTVYGDIDQPTSGTVLQFSCRNRGDLLVGAAQIYCGENGQWSDEAPICKVISCATPELDHFQVEGERTVYMEREVLRYSCDRGYKKVDGRPSMCMKMGLSAQWVPSPQCELIRCKLDPKPPRGTSYSPRNQIIFDPGHSVRVTCGNKQWVKSTELQRAELICQSTGNWDFDPVCQKVRCSKFDEHVYQWGSYWTTSLDIDETEQYSCKSGYEKSESRATCTRQGWEPKPLCKEKGCTKPSHKNAEITDNEQYYNYKHNDTVNFKCTYGEHTEVFSYSCYFGQWHTSHPLPTCKGKPCSTQPNIEYGELLPNQRQKSQYDDGESLLFTCTGETGTFQVTCQSGVWESKTCRDIRCKRQPAIKNAVMVSPVKTFYQHSYSVELSCTTGSKETFTATCLLGQWMTTHECQAVSVCQKAEIANGFSHEHQNKLYYTCSSGFKLPTECWWGEASCVGSRWETQECVASTCGPPEIPNLNVTYMNEEFDEGETIPIHCKKRYHNPNPALKLLTCTNGAWSPEGMDLKQICKPIEETCDPPPKVANAVILAEFKNKYLNTTVLTYKCRNDYKMVGNGRIQCNNGSWEQGQINCTAPIDQ